MRTFLAASILSVMLASAAFAGQPSREDMPQQQMAPPVVIIPQPAPKDDNSPMVPIVVAALGVVGVIGAAYVSRSRKKGE